MGRILRLALVVGSFMIAACSTDVRDPQPAPSESVAAPPAAANGGTSTPGEPHEPNGAEPVVPVTTVNEGVLEGAKCVVLGADVAVPGAGIAYEVTVDSRTLQRAHLVAQARTAVVESPASFELAIVENGAKLRDGWDVCVGASSPSCFANVELDPGIALRTFTLTAKTKPQAQAMRATIELCVFDPLE